MRSRCLLSFLLLALVAAVVPARAQGENLVFDGEAPDLFLLYTGDVIGYLEDCGCKKNPAGGLDRRSWVVNQLDEKFDGIPRVLLDSGNFSDNPTPQGDIKTRSLLQAMHRLGYDVVNVGERDIRLGYDEFARRTEGSDLRFISANIVRQDTQEPVFPPHAVIEVPGRDGEPMLRIGVVGVVRFNQIFLKAGPDGSNIVIAHPRDSLEREMVALREKDVDLVVVLGALPKTDAIRLVQDVTGIDYLMGAYGGVYTMRPEKYGETSVLFAGNRGQRISESRLFLTEGEHPRVAKDVHRMHFLTRQYPVDDEMLAFLASLATEGEGSGETGGQPASKP